MIVPVPITDEQSKAVAATADLGKVVVHEGASFARAVGRIFGTVPEDVVGLVIGDHLRFIRAKNALFYDEKISEIHRRRDVKQTEPVSPSLAIPLLTAAYDESRPELQALWAELIAAAMDPSRSDRVRLSFINALKQFDPVDSLVLEERCAIAGGLTNAIEFMMSKTQRSLPEVHISIANLVRLDCAALPNGNIDIFNATYFGRELISVCKG